MNISIAKKITFLTLALFANTSFSNSNNLFNAGVPSLAPMLKDVTPAVVNIYTINETKEKNSYIDDPFLRKFFNIQNLIRKFSFLSFLHDTTKESLFFLAKFNIRLILFGLSSPSPSIIVI